MVTRFRFRISSPCCRNSTGYHSLSPLGNSTLPSIRRSSDSNLPNGFVDRYLSNVCSFRSSKLPARLSTGNRDRSSDHNISRSNYLITKLCREGKMTEARTLFDQMPERDVVTWTALISGYVKHGMLAEARLLFDHPSAKKNVITWTSLLAGYLRFKQISEAEKLFQQMPQRNVVSWNTMISGYAENGRIQDAYDLFKIAPERNVVSWNTIITSLAQVGNVEEAYELFKRMTERDVISWTAMVAGLSQNGRIDEARKLFDRMPEKNIVSWNAMVTGYIQNMRLSEALFLFERMPERDLPSWNTMITGFIQNGDMKRARSLFDEMPERNVVSWTAIIMGYSQDGQCEEAIKLFSRMQSDGIKPNQATFVSVLGACSSLAGIIEGKQIHQIINKTNFQFSAFVESALISMYAKCGEIGTGREIFDRSNQKDLVYWNAMVAAYGHHGNGREAIRLFEELQKSGFKPDDVTYVALLTACSHSGLVNEGLKYFDELVKNSSIETREDHFACFVDLCGRAGRLDEAVKFIDGLRMKPSACVWGALLSGCNVHGNTKIGELAAKRLLEVEPGNAGTYMLLVNIYASAGKWKQAAKWRLKMKTSGLKKQPGCSWIELNNRVHVFLARGNSHSREEEAEEIYLLLKGLHRELKKAGYVPRVNVD